MPTSISLQAERPRFLEEETHYLALGNLSCHSKSDSVPKALLSYSLNTRSKNCRQCFPRFLRTHGNVLKDQDPWGQEERGPNGLGNAACCAERQVTMHLMNKTSCTTYRKDESGPPVSVEGYLQSLDPVVQH